MSRQLPVSLVQFDPYPLAPVENFARICEIIKEQATQGAKLVVFPELSNTAYIEPLMPGLGFSSKSYELDYSFQLNKASADLHGPYITELKSLAIDKEIFINIGLSIRHPTLQGSLYNSSLLFAPSGQVIVYNKMHRWHMEKIYFHAGKDIVIHPSEYGNIGLQICYDIRFPELTRRMALSGAEIVTNIWASFRHRDKPIEDPQTFIHRSYTRAIENGVFFLSCNRSGIQGECQFLGRSCIVSPSGKIIASSNSEQFDIVQGILDLDEVVKYRSYVGLFTDRRPDIYGDLHP